MFVLIIFFVERRQLNEATLYFKEVFYEKTIKFIKIDGLCRRA